MAVQKPLVLVAGVVQQIAAGDVINTVAVANPTASVGLAPVNGSAATVMRSDAAPQLDQSITPTWTGAHIFSSTVALSAGTSGSIPFLGASGVIQQDNSKLFWDDTNFVLKVGDVVTPAFRASGGVAQIGYAPTTFPSGAKDGVSIGTTADANAANNTNHAALSARATMTGSSNATSLFGANTDGIYNGTGTLTALFGYSGTARLTAAGTVTTANCLNGSLLASAGTIGTGNGLMISAPNVSGSGAITTVFGVHVAAQTHAGVTTAWGLALDGASDINRIAGSTSFGKITAPSQVVDVAGSGVATGVWVPGYQRIAPATGFSQTIANNVAALVLHPAATLATGTVTMPAKPLDGQTVLITSTQTVSALTVNGNTGQTMATAGPYALTAGTPLGFMWVATDTTWYRTQ